MTNYPSLRTGYLIKRVELLVRTKLEAALRDLGLTTGQYAALSLLASMPETSSAQLSRAIGVTPQTMAETIVGVVPAERRVLTRRAHSKGTFERTQANPSDNPVAERQNAAEKMRVARD
jgi:hypothetical protein